MQTFVYLLSAVNVGRIFVTHHAEGVECLFGGRNHSDSACCDNAAEVGGKLFWDNLILRHYAKRAPAIAGYAIEFAAVARAVKIDCPFTIEREAKRHSVRLSFGSA